MLQHTFIHIPNIGEKTERELWKGGFRSWSDVLNPPKGRSAPLSNLKKDLVRRYATKSLQAIEEGDVAFFLKLVQKGESWRVFREFADKCVYLDIETTGLSPVFDRITMVGLFDGRRYQAFVEGHNLKELREELAKYSVIVTFNGSQFDLRFLRIAFPEWRLPSYHIDLRFVTRKLGAVGGLKAVEKWFGIRRPEKIERLTGYDAAVLWSRYMRGDQGALNLLIDYNKEDVIHLRPIMEAAYESLSRQIAPFTRTERKPKSSLPELDKVRSTNGSFAKPTVSNRAVVHELLQKVSSLREFPRIVGIDLTGSEKRSSGWALLDGAKVSTKLLRSDDQIVAETLAVKADLVSIDSPLSLPAPNGKGPDRIYRECELALRRMGISVFWCLLPSMRPLTLRGMQLARNLRSKGLKVIESYPGAAQDILLIPRKKASTEELKWGLAQAGVQGDFIHSKVSHDELDAITSALVGLFYLADEYLPLGNAHEDYLIVPKSPQINSARLRQILSSMNLDLPSSL